MTTPGVATLTSSLGLSRSALDTATRTYMHVHVHVYHILSIVVKCLTNMLFIPVPDIRHIYTYMYIYNTYMYIFVRCLIHIEKCL